MSNVVLVCGGRDFRDNELLFLALDEFVDKADLLVHGGARGADALSGLWAESRGVAQCIFPANWKGEGKRAGYARNARMLDHMRPDMVVAFPGGRGTEMMCELASKRGVRVIRAT